MGIPNTFEAATIAASADVNENFQWLEDRIGGASTTTSLRPPGRIWLGPRDNYEISARADTVLGSNSYLQIAYNAENHYEGGGVWKVRRFEDGETATVMRIGKDGWWIWSTTKTKGDLSTQLVKVIGVTITGEDRFYVSPTVHIVKDTSPDSIEDYRLTYVSLASPQTIYNNASIKETSIRRDAYGYGIPTTAKGIQVLLEAVAGSGGGQWQIMQERSTRDRARGVILSAGSGDWGSTTGFVPLGEDGYAGKFVDKRTVNFTSASLWIVGYWM